MGHRTSSPSGMSGESYGAKINGKMDMLLQVYQMLFFIMLCYSMAVCQDAE